MSQALVVGSPTTVRLGSFHVPNDDAVCSPEDKNHRDRGMRGSGVVRLAHGRSYGRDMIVANTFSTKMPVRTTLTAEHVLFILADILPEVHSH
jgi:hypothetical protein